MLVVMAVLCLKGYQRSPQRRRTALLECLRFLIALLVVALLWQPEWRTVVEPTTKPRIALLWDASKSMQTTDAELPEILSSQREVVTRADFVQRVLASPWWQQVTANGQNEVVVRSFSANPEDPAAQSSAGTDLGTPLTDLLDQEDNLRAAIVISDGDWNQGQPPVAAAQKFLLRKIPLFTIPAGSAQRLPDLDLLAVNAPTYGIVGENMQIPFTIRSSLDREVRTTLRVRDDKGRERSKTIVLPANQTTYDSILWKLEKRGRRPWKFLFRWQKGNWLPRIMLASSPLRASRKKFVFSW